MNKLLLPFCVLAIGASAQQTIHSAGNGNAANPLTWDCLCFPTTDDHIFIDHHVIMNTDWAVTCGGSIEITAGASLLQDANRQLLIDGSGSELNNSGQLSFTDIAFTNGASGINTGQFSVDKALFFGAGTTYDNTGSMNGIDSMLTQGNFDNTGTLYTGNFLNTGTFLNTGHIDCDSMGNTGNFSSTGGYLTFWTFGNSGTFNMQTAGFMQVGNDWYNAGTFTLAAGREIFVGDDFYNGDTLGGTADLTNNGMIVVTGDFGNSDNINGSGKFCVGAYSANSGAVTGTVNFCDNSGTGNFDLNVGTVAGTVTYCGAGSCYLAVEENTSGKVMLYPNPATAFLNIESEENFETAAFYSVTGELVQTTVLTGKTIAINLPAGVYFVRLTGEKGEELLRLIVE